MCTSVAPVGHSYLPLPLSLGLPTRGREGRTCDRTRGVEGKRVEGGGIVCWGLEPFLQRDTVHPKTFKGASSGVSSSQTSSSFYDSYLSRSPLSHQGPSEVSPRTPRRYKTVVVPFSVQSLQVFPTLSSDWSGPLGTPDRGVPLQVHRLSGKDGPLVGVLLGPRWALGDEGGSVSGVKGEGGWEVGRTFKGTLG